MARYSLYKRRGTRSPRTRTWTRRRIYIISALVVIAVVAALICNPFGRRKAKTADNEMSLEIEQMENMPEPKLSEIPPEAILEANTEATKLIEEAMALINAKPSQIIDAREMLNDTLAMSMNSRQRRFIKGKLSELAEQWLFSRKIFPADRLCGTYKVRPGNLLSTIGKHFKVPHEIILEINKIDRPEALQAGQMIKVINGPFHARVYRSTFTMDLYLQNTFVRSFPVGLGGPGQETPTGLWRVEPGGKLIKPTWTDPVTGKTYEADDPDYPLGSRWIALEGIKGEAVGRNGFAIHGTKDPDQIGSIGSRGCIRLHNGDAILIYNLLVPGYSRVEIVE